VCEAQPAHKFRMLRLGYGTNNTVLREQHIFTGRTCRLNTALEYGVDYLLHLCRRNFEDLLKILEWNEAHGFRFYRIASDICPHITNPILLKKSDRNNYRQLAYSLESLRTLLEKIGKYARDHGHRLTFHPDPFVNLGGSDAIVVKSMRDLYHHSIMLDMMKLDLNSVMIVHGGGVYRNKARTMNRWIQTFNAMPIKIKRRIALENDEFSYNIMDVLEMSRHAKAYTNVKMKYKIPIVLDLFHYKCYEETVRIGEGLGLKKQISLADAIKEVVLSWKNRTPKFHISEQRPDAVRGAHSDYVRILPKLVLGFTKKYGNLDLMIEAKMKERATMYLIKKYKL